MPGLDGYQEYTQLKEKLKNQYDKVEECKRKEDEYLKEHHEASAKLVVALYKEIHETHVVAEDIKALLNSYIKEANKEINTIDFHLSNLKFNIGGITVQ